MKVLITGGTGLVGMNLKEELRDWNEVVSLSRREGVDLRDKLKVETFIKLWKPEVIYHLAANAAESRGEVSPIDMTERNLNMFLNVLTPAIGHGLKRFIYTSSVAVYGEAEVPYREDDICKPKDIYGVNKLAAEQILKILAKVHDFEYVIFRPHNIYGPHQDMSNPYKNIVALMMRNIMENTPITLFGKGKMKRAFSYVDDVVDVLVHAGTKSFKNQTINVGSSMDVEIHELLDEIEKIAHKKAKVIYKPARPQEIWNFLPSHKKLSLLYPYRETPLAVGLQKTWNSINLPVVVKEQNEIYTRS